MNEFNDTYLKTITKGRILYNMTFELLFYVYHSETKTSKIIEFSILLIDIYIYISNIKNECHVEVLLGSIYKDSKFIFVIRGVLFFRI